MKYADMAITVSDLNKYMKEKIAEDEYLNNILIKGEISKPTRICWLLPVDYAAMKQALPAFWEQAPTPVSMMEKRLSTTSLL